MCWSAPKHGPLFFCPLERSCFFSCLRLFCSLCNVGARLRRLKTKLGALLGQKLWFQFPTASTQVQSEHSAILAHCKQFDVCLDIVWTIESLNNVIRMGASFHWGPFGWTGRRHRRMWTWSASVRSANVGGPGPPKAFHLLKNTVAPFSHGTRRVGNGPFKEQCSRLGPPQNVRFHGNWWEGICQYTPAPSKAFPSVPEVSCVNEFRISLRCVSHPYMCLLLRSMSLCGLDMCEYPVDGISVQRDPFSQYSLFMQGMATCE